MPCSCADKHRCQCHQTRPRHRLVYAGPGRLRLVPIGGKHLDYAQGGGKPVNPWAVCMASTGRKDKEKYENCVMQVKKKHGIKR
jgi:galactokinase